MAFEIIAANTPAHLDGIFKIRHKVYCEEEGYLEPTDNGRLIDRFDTFPTTTNLAVLYEGQVVGGMRLTLDSEMGIPEDDYYDFRRHIPKDSYVMGCGKNCVTKELREPKIARGLILMGIYFAVSHGVSHIVSAITPNIAKLLKRVGFQALDDEMTIPDIRIPVIPALLDMRDLNDYFRNFAIKNQKMSIIL